MNAPDTEYIRQLVEFLRRPEGVYTVMKPGASKIPSDKILAFALASGVARIDVVKLKAAWVKSDGRPVVVAPPAVVSLDGVLRTEETKGEVFLTIDPSAKSLTLSDVVAWLNKGRFSGLDLDLIRNALKAPAGTPQCITRLLQPDRSAARRSGVRVLLVAADEASMATVAIVLSQYRAELSRVSSLEMAVFEATQDLPDTVIVDTSLGEATAIEICRRLASAARTSSTPVFVCCREATREFVRAALGSGARDLMVHPVSAAVVARKLAKVFEGARKPGSGPAAEEAGGAEASRLGKVDLDTLLTQIAKLQAIPVVVERVVRITGDVTAGAKELSQAVAMDAAATMLVMQVANSVAFGAARTIDNVAEAVTRIGFRQTRSLVVGRGVMQAFTSKTESVGFDRADCWRHALACAILAKSLAETAQVSSDLAFISGLLHDVGKVLLDEFATAEFEGAVRSAIQRHVPLRDSERELLQTTHVEVATHALRMWKFPDEIVDGVKFHHGLGSAGAGLSPDRRVLCLAIYAANAIAKATGIGNGGGDGFMSEVAEKVWDELSLRGGLPGAFWKHFDDEFRECHSFLGIAYEPAPRSAATRGVVLLSEEQPSSVSLARVALESAGWTVVKGSEPGSLPKEVPAGGLAGALLRCQTAEWLTAAFRVWEPALKDVPLVGLLPPGCAAPGGKTCLVEPYDREDLLKLLTPGGAS